MREYVPAKREYRAGDGHQEIDYVAAVELARAHDAATLRAFDDAGRALGVIIGAIADALDPEKIVLTGDGLAIVEFAGDTMHRSIAATRRPSDPPVPLEIQPFEFIEWARAGAAVAVLVPVELLTSSQRRVTTIR